MQNRMFTAFLILTLPPTIVNAVVPKFFTNMALWQAREYPSRIYGWFAFCTAQVVAEIPAAIIGAVVYWVLWYFATGLPTEASVSGYVFLMASSMRTTCTRFMTNRSRRPCSSSSSRLAGVSGSVPLHPRSLSFRTSCHSSSSCSRCLTVWCDHIP